MKIKNFIRSSALGGLVAVLCLSVTLLPLAGCSEQATLSALTKTLGSAAVNIANLEGNTSLAGKLTTDTAAAVSIITNWKSGTPAQNVIEALQIVEDDLNLIPGTSQYAPLIDIAIGTVQTILAMLPVPAGNTVAHGRVVHLGSPAPKNAHEFKKQWAGVIKLHPNLSAAAIK